MVVCISSLNIFLQHALSEENTIETVEVPVTQMCDTAFGACKLTVRYYIDFFGSRKV